MDDARFEACLNQAVDSLERDFPGICDNVAFCVETTAKAVRGQVAIRRHETLLGLYQGVPRSARTFGEAWMLPDKITLFRESIEAEAKFVDRPVEELIQEIVRHEVAHLLGLDEKRARAAEERSRRKRGG